MPVTSRQYGSASLGRRSKLCLLVLTLCACAPTPPHAPPRTAPDTPPGFPRALYEREFAGQGQVYRVAAEESRALFRVYRGGRLARLGHNHVVSARHLEGYVFVGNSMSDSRADLFVPLHRLVVDDDADRAAAGDDFSSELSADAIAGTRANMLGERGLHAERFPFIEITAVIKDAAPPKARLALTITLHGVTQQLLVPARLEIKDDELRAAGDFEIMQSAFGITPFSALGGALLVQDPVQVSFSVLARRMP